ncbi:hypothetical protein OAM78_06240 [Alphaproteobacteria bacterium]|jgi:hypothetical protein|nr:hypothetical protein [Alphaproteobacteria bacterium]MDC0444909.1 hypothetical protein [Alphaproteobacteria bacterium]
MGQQVSIIELKEQIEAAKRSLAEMSPVDIAADPLFQPAAMPTANFAGLAGGHEDDAPDAFNQNLPANDDMATGEMATGEMATGEDFQFFHRPKRSDRPFAPSSPMSMANADVSARGGDQLLFQAFDQRLDRLEDDIGQNRKHIHELITLLSDLDMAAQPALRNSASAKYLLRRNLYWFVIGLLVISWGALTPSGHYWINYFLGLI